MALSCWDTPSRIRVTDTPLLTATKSISTKFSSKVIVVTPISSVEGIHAITPWLA